MIGHELTAAFGVDHGQTLALVLPSLLEERRTQKRAKLLQYAEQVWHIESGSDEEKITLAIEKTRAFFESLGVRAHLSQYGVGSDKVPVIVDQLQSRGMTALSEGQNLTLEISQRILERALQLACSNRVEAGIPGSCNERSGRKEGIESTSSKMEQSPQREEMRVRFEDSGGWSK